MRQKKLPSQRVSLLFRGLILFFVGPYMFQLPQKLVPLEGRYLYFKFIPLKIGQLGIGKLILITETWKSTWKDCHQKE